MTTIQYRNEPNRNVINLSKRSFTKGEYNLLNKSVNFCLYYNRKQIESDLENFYRTVKLKKHFIVNTKMKSNINTY